VIDSRSPDALEARYRLLLRTYPVSYRVEREDEIVGVLMDGAEPGQSRPSMADAIDLVRAGLVTRLRTGRTGGSYAPTPWRDAVAIVTVLLPALLAVRALRPFGMLVSLTFVMPWEWQPYSHQLFEGWQAPALWVLVLVVLMVVPRRVPALLATVAVGFDVALVVQLANRSSAYLAERQVTILAVELVAAILLWRRADVERGLTLVGRSSVGRVAVATALLQAATNTLPGLHLRGGWSTAGVIVGSAALLSVAWSGRRHVRPLGLRLAVPATALALMVVVGQQAGRMTTFAASGRKGLAIQLGLALIAGAVGALTSAGVVALSRRFGIQLRIVRRSSSS